MTARSVRRRTALVFSLIVTALAVPVAARTLGGDDGADISVWRVLAALILCLVLAVAAAFALRYRMRGDFALFGALLLDRSQRRLRLIESLRLGHQVDLCLVAIDGETMLLAVTTAGVTRLDAELAPEAASMTQ